MSGLCLLEERRRQPRHLLSQDWARWQNMERNGGGVEGIGQRESRAAMARQ